MDDKPKYVLKKRGWFGNTGRPVRDFIMGCLDLITIVLLVVAFVGGLFFSPSYDIVVKVDQMGNICGISLPENLENLSINSDVLEKTIKDELSSGVGD